MNGAWERGGPVRAEPDELFMLTADEVAESSKPCSISTRDLTCVSFAVIWLGLLVALLASGWAVLDHSLTNWFDGAGFTPVAHVQEITPASFTQPASVTFLTLPGEEAQR